MKTSRKSSGRTWVALIAIALVILCMTLFLTSCNNEPEQPVQPEQPAQPDQPAHTHTISTEWSSDDSDHWHEASCGDPSHNEDKAVHTWNAGVVTTPATELTDGVKTFTCTVCGKTKTQVIPAGHEHEYPDYWMYRQVTGDVQKYKVCTYCDEEITETAEYTDVFKVTEGAISCKWIDALERCEIITGDWTIPSVVGSDAVTKIYDAAFYGETGLTSVEIPSSVTRIGYSAFEGCDNLSSITIPASVTTIDGNLLSYCNAPVQITIDAGNPNFCISDGMLFNKDKTVLISGLNKGGSITVPDGVTEIGEGAFDLNAAVTDVVLPDSVTTIGYGAFFECENLESINIPVATVAISDDVFSYCSSLTSIDVAASNPNYSSEDGALYNKTKTELLTYPSASGAVSIRDGVTSIARSAMQGCSAVTSLVIPNSVTHIDHYSFEGCSEITSLTIPDSVTEIGWNAFAYCSKLTEVTVGVKAARYEGSDIFKETPAHIIFKSGAERTTIPGGFLNGGSKITEVTIPDTVTKICDSALMKCSSITEIILPDAVTTIENNAFRECLGLERITIPSGVTSIGNAAFKDCTGLSQITFGGTKAQWTAMYKSSGWRSGVPESCKVKCTDEEIFITQ